jgi:uncharacterized membrane protein
MGLSPEERQKIYEEEKARIEARERIEREKYQAAGGSSTGLAPNIAGLLCYVLGWISGIIFLVLEQKNRWVRFHAAQSLVVFGTLTIAGLILGWIPVVGTIFASIISFAGVILWVILMVKAYNNERFEIPWASDVADSIITASVVKEEGRKPATPPSTTAAEAAQPSAADLSQQINQQVKEYFKRRNEARIATSSFIIACSIVLLIFFNFFHQYVAYYHSETAGGVTVWTKEPFFTQDINTWLPLLTTTLVLTIIGYAALMLFNREALDGIIKIVLGALGLATAATLLAIFPFDFSVIPDATAADVTDLCVRVFLILVSVGLGIGIFVRLIKLIVHVVRRSPA